MAKDFFEFTSVNLPKLNETEQKLFNYVARNMDKVKHMSIRMFAHECFISTTTVFRFVKKLGFLGYNQFVAMLQLTDDTAENAIIPQAMKGRGCREEYLKNIIESIRVIKPESIKELTRLLKMRPKIYLFASGLTIQAARYAAHLFTVLGFDCELAAEEYQIAAAIKRISTGDLVFVLSYTGATKSIVSTIEKIKQNSHAKIVSITRADNNVTQMLSDINFYFFADDLHFNGASITSRISVIAILETILYEFISSDGSSFTNE